MPRLARKRSAKTSCSESKQGQTTPLQKLQRTETTVSESVAGADVGLPESNTEEVVSPARGDETFLSGFSPRAVSQFAKSTKGKKNYASSRKLSVPASSEKHVEDNSEKVVNPAGDNSQDVTCGDGSECTEKERDDEKEVKTTPDVEITVSKEDDANHINICKQSVKSGISVELNAEKNDESFAAVKAEELQRSTESETTPCILKAKAGSSQASSSNHDELVDETCGTQLSSCTARQGAESTSSTNSQALDTHIVGCVKQVEPTTTEGCETQQFATAKNEEHMPGITACPAQPVMESQRSNQVARSSSQNKGKPNTTGITDQPETAKSEDQPIKGKNAVEIIVGGIQITDQPIKAKDTKRPTMSQIADQPVTLQDSKQTPTLQITNQPHSTQTENQTIKLSHNTDQPVISSVQSTLKPVTLSQETEKLTDTQILERSLMRDTSSDKSVKNVDPQINTDNPYHLQFNMEDKFLSALCKDKVAVDDAVKECEKYENEVEPGDISTFYQDKRKTETGRCIQVESETESKSKHEDLESESLDHTDTQSFLPTDDQVHVDPDEVGLDILESHAKPGCSVAKSVGPDETIEDGDITDSQLCSMEWEARDTVSSDKGKANRATVANFGRPVRVVSPETTSPAPSQPADGTKVVQGLIKELASINQSLVKTTREIDAIRARQQGKENQKPHIWQ